MKKKNEGKEEGRNGQSGEKEIKKKDKRRRRTKKISERRNGEAIEENKKEGRKSG